jgi:hypothetical protein
MQQKIGDFRHSSAGASNVVDKVRLANIAREHCA